MLYDTTSHEQSLLLDAIPCASFKVTKEGNRFVYTLSFISKALLTELELAKKDALNDFSKFLDLLNPLHKASLLAVLELSACEYTDWKWEGCFKMPSSHKKWFQCISRTSRLSAQTVVFNAIFSDITAFKLNDEMLRETSDLMKTGSWEFDIAGLQLSWSAEVYRIYEIDPAEVPDPGTSLGYYQPWARILLVKAISRAKKLGTAWDIELELTTGRGNKIWVRSLGKAIHKFGKAVKLYGVFQDITAKKLSEERLSVIFEHSTEPHFLSNKDGFIDSNPAAVALLRCKDKAQLLGQRLSVFSPDRQPDGRRSSEKAAVMRNLAYEKGYHRFEWLHRKFDGELFSTIVTLTAVHLNNELVLLGVWHDITERKTAEKIIQRNEAMLSETQALTHSGSWEADLVTGKNYWSEEAFRIFGLEPSIEGPDTRFFGRMVHPDDRALYKEQVAKSILLKEVAGFDLRIVRPGGEIRNINAIGKPIMDGKGNVVKLYGAIQDITQIKNAEKELIKAKEMAEEAALAKTQFLSTMSHEIRTPMNAVIGFTNLLLQKNPNPEQLKFLNVLKFSGENLLVLINDILDFTKIEEGKIAFEYVDFSVNELLINIRMAFLQTAQDKGLQLNLMVDSDLSNAVIGDPVRLGQILTNLVSNALKFTAHGSVSISALFGGMNNKETSIDFEVADTGIGIPEEKFATIFERFTQASSDTTRNYGGTGLGLTITKMLIELQGGAINLSSQVGEGSQFKFTLRFKNGNNDSIRSTKKLESHAMTSLKGTRVLMAEDNTINCMLVEQFMKIWEVECDVVANGLLAVAQVQAKEYDMVLMDLQMPEMDGYQASYAIRQLEGEKFRSLPIIALTASAMLDIKDRAFEFGMNDYLSKPFNPSELHRKIKMYSLTC